MNKNNSAKEQKKNRIPKVSANIPKEHGMLLKSSVKEMLEEYQKINVMFSFKFFDRNEELFNCGGIEASWFIDLMDVLKDVSSMKFEEFRYKGGPPLRVHPHEWIKTSKKYPFNEEFLMQIEQNTLQFSVSKANGRVHGFVIENVFYVVWLDRYHNLYPMQTHGGLTYCDFPEGCYECLEKENKELKEENEILLSECCRLEEEIKMLKTS